MRVKVIDLSRDRDSDDDDRRRSRRARGRYPVDRVVKLQPEDDGHITRIELYRSRRRHKGNKGMLDRLLYRFMRAQEIAASDYLVRHKRANNKRRREALRRAPENLMLASLKGLRRSRLYRW